MKKFFTLLLLATVVICVVAGCSSNHNANSIGKADLNSKENQQGKFTFGDQVEKDGKNDSKLTDEKADSYKGRITETASEKKPLSKVERFIIDYYEIPRQYWSDTKYYYNYVDLNEDGIREIFVVIRGSYTSGTGGSSALWLKNDEVITSTCVLQAFTLIQLPIIISKNTSSGYRELIVPYHDNAVNKFKILTNYDGKYVSVEQGKLIASLEKVYGEAILVDGNASGEKGVKLELGKGL